jgi:hypothetical protein
LTRRLVDLVEVIVGRRIDSVMWDIFYLAITVSFFGVAAAFVRGCDRL